jgi:hypothetical protein
MDERAIRLLEEIRDQQREHLELYREAVKNQEASIRMQAEAVKMQRSAVTRVVPSIIILVIALGALFALMHR